MILPRFKTGSARQGDGQRETLLFCAISVYDQIGGIQKFNQRVIEAALLPDKADRRIIVLSLDDHDARSSDRLEFAGFGGKRLRFFGGFLKTLLRDKPGVVLLGHINLLRLGAFARLLRPGVTVALFAHGVEVWNDARYRLKRPYEPPLLKRCIDAVICVSAFTAATMSREYGLDRGKFHELPNSIDLDERDPCDLSRGSLSRHRLLSVTRLDEQYKCIGQVMCALRRLRTRLPSIEYSVVGEGTLRPHLEAFARAIGVEDCVRFVGRISEARLLEEYRNADLFILPSKKEGFGIVFLEAWKYGLPVICGKEGASSEVVIDGESGVVVDPDDIQGLARAIERVLENPEFAAALARNGIGRLRRNYTFPAFVQSFYAILDALFAASGRTKRDAATV